LHKIFLPIIRVPYVGEEFGLTEIEDETRIFTRRKAELFGKNLAKKGLIIFPFELKFSLGLIEKNLGSVVN